MSFNPLVALHETQCTNIYNALDSRNPKKAIAECDKVIASNSFPLVLALKSVALIRLDRLDQAQLLCNQVLSQLESNSKSNNPQIQVLGLDHATLMALDISLDDLGRGGEMLNLLERATKLQPGNEAIWLKYFKRLVAQAEWMKAQQISFKMSKQFNSSQYFWWSIQSYVLLSTKPDLPGSKLSLPLSTRMITTHLKEKPLDSNSDQILHLYCSVLIKQNLFKEVVELLESDNSKSIRKRDMGLEILRMECLEKLGSWETIWTESKEKVEKGDRNWATMISLVSSSSQLSTNSNSSTQINDTISLISQLVSKSPLDRSLRLAQLELSKVIQASNPDSESISTESLDLLTLCSNYFKDLASKPCCFEDLKPYLNELSSEQKRSLVESLKKRDEVGFQNLKDLSIYINEEKMRRYLKEQTTEDEELQDCKRLSKTYLEGLKLGSDLPPTEMQPADDLALLASHCLISASSISKENKLKHLIEALSLLTFSTSKSPKGYQLRILSVRLLKLLGCFKSALKEYHQIGIKAIQLDTLSHLIAEKSEIFSGGANENDKIEDQKRERQHKRDREESSTALQVINDSEEIYGSNQEETPSIISRAFDLGTYSRLEEFVDFHSRLDLSINRQLLRLSKARFLLRSTLQKETSKLKEVTAEVEKVNQALKLGSPYDQRDFSVIPSYQSKSALPKSIDESTSMGSRSGIQWISFVLQVLSLLCGVEVDIPDTISTDELSPPEASFLGMVRILASREPGRSISEEQKDQIVSFFRERKESIESSGPEVLPWEILNESQIIAEAYGLLSTLSQRASEASDILSLRATCLPLIQSISSNLLSRSEAVTSEQWKDEIISKLESGSSWYGVADEQAKQRCRDLVKSLGDEIAEAFRDSARLIDSTIE